MKSTEIEADGGNARDGGGSVPHSDAGAVDGADGEGATGEDAGIALADAGGDFMPYPPCSGEDCAIPEDPAITTRQGHAAVWTGREMIIWGGKAPGGARLGDGAAYSPASRRWRRIASGGPPASHAVIAAWTGSEMIVWGSEGGGRYDPSTDAWRAMASGGPTGFFFEAVWTGSRMLVWTPVNGCPTSRSGVSYDPVMDVWTPLPDDPAVRWRQGEKMTWLGDVVVSFPGIASMECSSGRQDPLAYDPVTERWFTWWPGTASYFEQGEGFAVAAIGRRAAVWGGSRGGRDVHSFLSAYEYPSAELTSLPQPPGPVRSYHTMVWTGTELIVWGGVDSTNHFVPGGWRIPYTP